MDPVVVSQKAVLDLGLVVVQGGRCAGGHGVWTYFVLPRLCLVFASALVSQMDRTRCCYRGPRFLYPIGVWFPVAGKNGEKQGKTGKNGEKRGKRRKNGGKTGKNGGNLGGGDFGQDPPTRLLPPPPPFIILWGAFFANQIEAKALSRVRHPSPKG